MKKAISLLLAIVMVIGMMPLTAFAAEGDPAITFTTTFTNDLVKGDTFTVTATLANNPGIASFTNSLKWNDAVVEFLGFMEEYDEDEEADVLVTDIFKQSGWSFVAGESGIFTAARENNRTKNGVLYVAEFKIIADEGALELGLTTMEHGEEFTFADELGNNIDPVMDFSAISGLTVGGKPVGPEMPETLAELGVSAITTDAGAAIAVEDCGTLPIDPWGMGMGTDTPYYHITIPADASEAYVTFDAPYSAFMSQTAADGTPEIGSAWSIANEGETESGMAGLAFIESGDQTVVIIPLEFNGDPWGGEEMKSTVKVYYEEDDEYDLFYAVGPQDAGANTMAVFSLEFGEAISDKETYPITVNQTTGGTVSVYNEEGEEITEAAANEYILVDAQAATGYKFKYVTVNGEAVELMNGFFKMPAEAVEVSAVFEEVHICEYKEVAAEAFLKQEATCQSGAVYYKSCECGGKSEQTFISGDPVACVYENGVCKWCGEEEPVLAPGYRFATSADVSAENGGTAVVHVKITGHSDPSVTKYNAYDITLTFDSDKLEYVDYAGAVKSDNGRVEVDKENGTIRIVGCGEDKDFGTEIAALTFKTKAEGAANVTISKVQVSDKEEAVKEDIPEATPKHEEDDPEADETPDVSVVVVPYSVTKPDFVSGNDKILHGEDYTFSYTDTTNYTYSDLIVKVGGVEVAPVENNGVYTIENVTGAIEITATQTANSYDVTKPENVTGPDKATYGTDYVFTVTPSKEDMAIDTVTVQYADGSEVPYTINENGEYVIAGADIAGAFEITVTEKEKMTTVTFSGIEETKIEGGLTQTAEIGKEFTFKLIKEEGYDYTVKVGETELAESEESAGQYTIPGELVVKDGVQVVITKEDNTKPVVDVTEYISLDGKAMFLVTAKWKDKVLAYGEDTMFWSDKYTVTGETEAGAYCWLVLSTDEMNTIELVKAAAEAAIVEAPEGATVTAVKYNYDINGTTKVDVNDAQLAYDMYNASYMDFTDNLPMLKFLEADIETDSKLDTKDVAAIISYIITK